MSSDDRSLSSVKSVIPVSQQEFTFADTCRISKARSCNTLAKAQLFFFKGRK